MALLYCLEERAKPIPTNDGLTPRAGDAATPAQFMRDWRASVEHPTPAEGLRWLAIKHSEQRASLVCITMLPKTIIVLFVS